MNVENPKQRLSKQQGNNIRKHNQIILSTDKIHNLGQ